MGTRIFGMFTLGITMITAGFFAEEMQNLRVCRLSRPALESIRGGEICYMAATITCGQSPSSCGGPGCREKWELSFIRVMNPRALNNRNMIITLRQVKVTSTWRSRRKCPATSFTRVAAPMTTRRCAQTIPVQTSGSRTQKSTSKCPTRPQAGVPTPSLSG